MKSQKSMNTQKRVMIALYNMGGPAGQEEVEPFLRALFNDPDLLDIPLGGLLQNFVASKIINKRLEEVKTRYQHMGGGSPQLPITRGVAEKLQAAIFANPRGLNLFSSKSQYESPNPFSLAGVIPLFRYSEPRAKTVLQQCASNQIDELWLLSQYPHCARATTGTSLREIGLEQNSNSSLGSIRIRSFASYGDDPNFLELWTSRVKESWQALPEGRKHLLISAHNLPLSYVADGDPYPMQIRRTAQEVTRRLGLHEGIHWTLCWQSAVGPVRWMDPTTDKTIEELCSSGTEHMLVWPVAFVSDHIETLVEIDLEYAEMAKKQGVKTFSRVKNFDTDPDFINFLALQVIRAATDLLQCPDTPLLRDFNIRAAGPFCSAQPGGCLCANYYLSGRNGLERGKSFVRIDSDSKP